MASDDVQPSGGGGGSDPAGLPQDERELFFEEGPLLFLTLDVNRTILNITPYGARQLGYLPTELIGQPLQLLVFPDEVERIEKQVSQSLAEPGRTFTTHFRKRRKDGTPVWFKESTRTVQTPDGTPIVLIACTDINEQKELERAFLDKNRLLQLIVRNVGEGLIVVDHSYNFLIYNDQARELLGVEPMGPYPEQWAGYFGIYLPDTVTLCPVEQLPLIRALRGEEATVELYLRNPYRPEGRWTLTTLGPLRNDQGEIEGGIVVFRDVTDAKQLLETLKERSNQLLEAQELAHLGSWDWEIETDRLTWSDELFRIYGLEPGEWTPTYEGFLARIHPEDRERTDRTVKQALVTRQAFEFEHRVILPDESVRTLHGRGEVTLRSDGTPCRMVGTGQDITERKALEMKLREQYEKLKEIDKLKSNFVNSVTHELRTPLTSIMGYAEFLEDEVGGPLTEAQLQFVCELERGARRLENLLNDLLDFARLEAGTFKLAIQEVDLIQKVRESVDSMRPQALENHLTVSLNLPEGPLRIPIDEKRIGQVLINLLNNAIKFTSPGGSLTISLSRERDHVLIRVADTGVGIPPEDLPKLFQRFVQLESGLRKGSGSGLGLSISKSIVESHGGRIGVESEADKGSVFWFTLPFQPTVI